MKRMGLVKCNESLKVLKIKPAYYSLQGIASVFDASIKPEKIETKLECEKKTAVYTFRQENSKVPLIAYWDSSSHPENDNSTTPGQLTVTGVKFNNPVWVDTVTCAIYEIPQDRITVKGETTTFKTCRSTMPQLTSRKKSLSCRENSRTANIALYPNNRINDTA